MTGPTTPIQNRSRESLERILEATESLLERRLFSDITVQDIASEAGVSTGLLYSRFNSKDEILPFLVGRFLDEQVGCFHEGLSSDEESPGLEGRIGRLVDRVRGMARRSLGLLRAAAARRILNPHTIGEAELARTQQIRVIGEHWLLAGVGEVRREHPERALSFANWMVFLVGQIGPMLIDDERELDATMGNLTTALTLFLTTPGPTRIPVEGDAA